MREGDVVALIQPQLLQQFRLPLAKSLAGLFNRLFVPDVPPYHRVAVRVLVVQGHARLPVRPLQKATSDVARGSDNALGYAKFFVLETSRVELFIQSNDLAVREIARVFQCNPSSAADDVILVNLCNALDCD